MPAPVSPPSPPPRPPTAPSGDQLRRDGAKAGRAALQGALRQVAEVVAPDAPPVNPRRTTIDVARATIKGGLEHLAQHPENAVSALLADIEASTGALSTLGRAISSIANKPPPAK
jgi:hypothetical protein